MYRLLFLAAIILFGTSLFLPVYNGNTLPGYMALLLGWMVGANDWASAVSWFANVMFIIAVMKFLKKKNAKPSSAMIFGVLAICLGLAALGAGKAFISKDSSQTIQNFSMGLAFYLWIGSFLLITIASGMKMKKLSEQPNPNVDGLVGTSKG